MMNNKTKIGLSLSAELLKLEESRRSELGFASRSELIEAAVYEYISKREVARFADTVANIYEQINEQLMADFEDRIAKLLYKIAIELAQNNLLMGRLFELDETDIYELRKHAYRLVKENKGRISFRKAVERARTLDIEAGRKSLFGFYDEEDES